MEYILDLISNESCQIVERILNDSSIQNLTEKIRELIDRIEESNGIKRTNKI